jgi:hypothetical protein
MLVKVFKTRESVIQNVSIHTSFYERLMSVLHYFSSPEELVALKETSPEDFKYHQETLLILFSTMDALAVEQGLIADTEVDLDSLESDVQPPAAS